MKVLLYYTGNKRSIALETLLREYVDHGHEGYLFTTCEPGELHERVAAFGVHTSGSFQVPKDKFHYAAHIQHLVQYCWRHGIHVVLSQLQQANIVAVFAERMTSARFYMFRHHPRPHIRKEKMVDWIVNHMAQTIVVLTDGQRQILRDEGVPERKILLLPPMYNFDAYTVSNDAVQSIRNTYKCDLLVIMLSRLVHYKRHMIAFQAVEEANARGRDIRLLVMDDGPEQDTLQRFVKERSLENRVSFLGYRADVLDYLEASDVLIHPSISEVSAHAVKEAGIRGKIVLACRGVGDFDEYLEHMENSVVFDGTDGPSKFADCLVDIVDHRSKYSALGARLRERVVAKFARSPRIVDQYLRLATA